MKDIWVNAARSWQQFKPPTRPSSYEHNLLSALLAQYSCDAPLEQVVVLGSTPEYYKLPWPGSTAVFAIDSSAAMLRQIWPGPASSAVLGQWQALPLATGTVDLVLLDTGLCLLDWPEQQSRVIQEIARVLRPGGRCCTRLIVMPESPQTPARIFAAIRKRDISELPVLRLYLCMALQASTGRAVSNLEVWDALKQEFGTWTKLAQIMDCDEGDLKDFIETRTHQAGPEFHFATESDYARLFRQPETGLSIETVFRPPYQRGELYPTCVLRKSPLQFSRTIKAGNANG